MHPLLTPDVLRRQVVQHVEAAHRGEVTHDWLRGYLTAMFHAGAITIEECQQLIAGERAPFELTPDNLPHQPAPDLRDPERGQ